MSTGATPPGKTQAELKLPDTQNPGWAIFSYLLAGMIFYGGAGWVLGRWVVHSALCFPLGMVVGLALSIVLVILRYGRA